MSGRTRTDGETVGNDRAWHTSVDDLVSVFHDALRALTPTLDRGHVRWRSPGTYDQWDAIAATIWEVIVVDALRNADRVNPAATFPAYGLMCDDYSSMSYVAVQEGSDFYPIIELELLSERDAVLFCACLDGAEHRSNTKRIPLPSGSIVLRLRAEDARLHTVQELIVDDN